MIHLNRVYRIIGKTCIIKALCTFLFVQILIISWREMVLGIHGFQGHVFDYVSFSSLLFSIILSLVLVTIVVLDEKYCKGYILISLWGLLSYSFLSYIVKQSFVLSAFYETLFLFLFLGLCLFSWRIIEKSSSLNRKGYRWRTLAGILSLIIITILTIKNSLLQAIVLFLLFSIPVFLTYSMKIRLERKTLCLIIIAICIVAWSTYSSYKLGEYGNSYIEYDGKQYKVLYIDNSYYYCEDNSGSLLVPNEQ